MIASTLYRKRFRTSRARPCTACSSATASAVYPARTGGPPKKKFKDYPIGYLHVDFAEVHTEEGSMYLFVAIDRTSKLPLPIAAPAPRIGRRLSRRVLASYPL